MYFDYYYFQNMYHLKMFLNLQQNNSHRVYNFYFYGLLYLYFNNKPIIFNSSETYHVLGIEIDVSFIDITLLQDSGNVTR